MLLVLGGLPGTGKTTIARELARRLAAVHIRIDTIEQAIREAYAPDRPMNDAGYRVGYAIAEDNLRLGRTVIADSVNPLRITRDAWRDVARRAGVAFVEVELTCSDVNEHRRRIETRRTDIPRSKQPTWQDVVDREYESWDRERTAIDTAHRGLEEIIAEIAAALRGTRPA